MDSQARDSTPGQPRTTLVITTAATGIVYGDPGTSPLYTYRAIVQATIMLTWHRGVGTLRTSDAEREHTIGAFLERLHAADVARVPGTAVFLSRSSTAARWRPMTSSTSRPGTR